MRGRLPLLLGVIGLTSACSWVLETDGFTGGFGVDARTMNAEAPEAGQAREDAGPRDAFVDATPMGSPEAAVDPTDAPAKDAEVVAPPHAPPDAPPPVAPPPSNTLVALDKGKMSAVVVGTDDLPLVFFWAEKLVEQHDLGLLRCLDRNCGSFEVEALEVPGNAGIHVRAGIDPRGMPVASYNQAGYGEAKIRRCRDKRCEKSDAWFFETGSVQMNYGLGEWSSLAFNAEGNPVVSYYDPAAGDLRIAICQRFDCWDVGKTCAVSINPPNVHKVAGETTSVGEYSSLVFTQAGLPMTTYYNATEGTLELSVCSDKDCVGSVVKRTLDGGGGRNAGMFTAAVVPSDGLPVVFYYDVTSGDLKRAKCLDETCEKASTKVIDGTGSVDVGTYTSAILGADGLPIVAYHDQTQGNLKFARCRDLSCDAVATVTIDDSAERVGTWTSITVRKTDGLPVISYRNEETGVMKLAFCGSPSCGAL